MNFKLSPEAIRLLCYQRSQYCDLIGMAYLTEMRQIYLEIKEYLPKSIHNILDIGAGMAGIDVFLSQHYPGTKITLLDKEGYKEDYKSKIGYHKDSKTFGAYNSFDEAKRLLSQNKIKMTCVDIGSQKFPNIKFDLIVSFLSWGFHYPLNTYASLITKPCTIICDVRKGTDDGSLDRGKVIYTGLKYERKLYAC